jgi:cell division transport system permease protein
VHAPPTEEEQAGTDASVVPSFASPLVPAQRVAGRALIVVVAIMTFLATVTVGAMTVVRSAADDWQADIVAEMTVQLKPVDGIEASQQIDETLAALRGLPGIGEVRALSVRETGALLEPWIGAGVDLASLPVPRLVLVGIDDRGAVDPAAVRAAVEAIPGAALDDHRAWGEELATTARTVTVVGLVLVALMLVALVISVVFATRAAMASNARTIEVLHFCGAHAGFIARQFERRFLLLGLAGGAIGSGAAILVFAALMILARFGSGSIGDQQARLLFGTPEVGLAGYAAAVALVAAVGLIAAITTRLAVHAHLSQLD